MDARSIQKHQAIIKRLGTQRLVEFTGLTRPAINHWLRRGIPKGWLAAISGLPDARSNGGRK